MSGGTRGAIFLDRDGTIIADAHYLSDASRVQLLPGAGAAVALANNANIPVVVVTNQSGIARGLITVAQYAAVAHEVDRLLKASGAYVNATYYCPHWPDANHPCECRKPALGMYRQAAAEHALDLAQSACIGDRWRDVEPALRLGGLGILVPGSESSPEDVEHGRSDARVAESLGQAVTESIAWMKQFD